VVRFVVVKASCDQCESETSDIIFVRILIEEATVGHVGPHGFKRHLAFLLYRVKSVFDAIRHRLFGLFVLRIFIDRHYYGCRSVTTGSAVTTDSAGRHTGRHYGLGRLHGGHSAVSELARWGSDNAAEA
jgi:hypothetical protein